jgi:hypothetical protein
MNLLSRINSIFWLPFIVLVIVTFAAFPAKADTYQISPEADTYVREDYATTNYGDQTYLQVGCSGGTADYRYWSYLRFNLNISEMSENEYITNVTLNLYQEDGTGHEGNTVNLLFVAVDSWIESGEEGMTWNTRKGMYDDISESLEIADGWNQWSFSLPEDDSSPDVLSLGLRANDNDTFNYNSFKSKEFSINESFRPYLEVTTAIIPVPGSFLLLASGLIGLGAVGWRRQRV